MKAKRKIINRIRGWFPQEPKILGNYVNNSSKNEKKWILFVSVALLFTLVITLVAFQVPRLIEGAYPEVNIRPDDSNLFIKGVIDSVEENHKSEGWGGYHIFRYYLKVNISEIVWMEDDLANWNRNEMLTVDKNIWIGYDYLDKPHIAVGQTIEAKGFYLIATESPQSGKLTVAPNISESYLKTTDIIENTS